MIFVIDNYDSFTYNLVQYIGTINPDIKVMRNNEFKMNFIANLKPSHIVISPGPGKPENSGLSIDVIKTFGKDIPILGVCLGHQCIAEAYGGKIVKASEIIHGKTSLIKQNGSIIFKGIDETFIATRYHSLMAEKKTLPAHLNITAELQNGIIMALEHKSHPVYVVQFHPESIATDVGITIIKNFLRV